MSTGAICFNEQNFEYYTPKYIVDMFGKFDYDPSQFSLVKDKDSNEEFLRYIGTETDGEKIKIPEGVSSGQSLRLKGLGLPDGDGYGVLNAKIKIVIPKNYSEEIKNLYKKIRELS